jgi:hypothetical protein
LKLDEKINKMTLFINERNSNRKILLLYKAGQRKEAVFPLPVLAIPIISRPLRAAGIAFKIG